MKVSTGVAIVHSLENSPPFPLGNTFSTVRGHIFEWTLLPDEEAIQQQYEPEAILNFVPFEESSYETDPVIGSIESRVSHREYRE